VQAADRVATSPRQPRICWRRYAERIVVRRFHQEIVGHALPAVGLPIVATGVVIVPGVDTEAGEQLVLHLGREIPVVVAHTVAVQHGWVVYGGRWIVLAEVLVANRGTF